MTDHIKTALATLESVHHWQAEEGQTDATLVAAAIDAQVHVTLALVDEQQKMNALLEKIAARMGSAVTVGSLSVVAGGPVEVEHHTLRAGL